LTRNNDSRSCCARLSVGETWQIGSKIAGCGYGQTFSHSLGLELAKRRSSKGTVERERQRLPEIRRARENEKVGTSRNGDSWWLPAVGSPIYELLIASTNWMIAPMQMRLTANMLNPINQRYRFG